MSDLFDQQAHQQLQREAPLAARMRPRTLEEFLGQQDVVGQGRLLFNAIEQDTPFSMILWGPPGTGKTTLATIIAQTTRSHYIPLSAVNAGVKDLHKAAADARDRLGMQRQRTILFIDEIHRFNKSQQDALLPDVEDGIISLVGATTSNPFFAVNSALVSRSQVFQFEPLDVESVRELVMRAIADPVRGFGRQEINIDDKALEFFAQVCDGDARRALSALEISILSSSERPLEITLDLARESVQKKAIEYDADGDVHYDTASALIKSIRGSDPDAALYWLARMLEGGEDIRFITRRLVILASEDVGNADPNALTLAVSCMQACEFVGLPECQLSLSQTVSYLACAPKSNAATASIAEARRDVREGRIVPVPVHLRDSHYRGAQKLGHGDGYQYSHNEDDGVASQDYLGVDREYYHPVDRGYEAELAERLVAIREKLKAAKEPDDS